MSGQTERLKRKAFMWTAGLLSLLLTCLLLFSGAMTEEGRAQTGIALYTPYPGIAVTPGESVDYRIEVYNHGSSIEYMTFEVRNIDPNWEYLLTSGGRQLKQLSVLPGESQNISLQVNIPLQVEKGEYRFQVVANGNQASAQLPLTIEVTEEGIASTEFTTEQPNMEGHSDSQFEFQATLRNRTAEEQLYALTAEAPRGWQVRFTVNNQNVTSVAVGANDTQNVRIHIQPMVDVPAGTYSIPIKAANQATSADLTLEVVITGSYDINLSTPTGRLNAEATAGKPQKVELQVTNEGSADLRDIKLESTTPINWTVEFEPAEIEHLPAGESTTVIATITPDSNAIAGDYVVNMEAKAPEASSTASFRVTVKTPLLWGWVGILIIAAVIAGIFYLFRQYGRR